MTAFASARRRAAPGGDRAAARVETRYRPGHELDLFRTVSGQRRGAIDPTMTSAGGVIWRATRTPAGVATVALRQRGDEVLAAAWGDGAAEALDQVPRLCGADDDPRAFDPGDHALVVQAHKNHPGLRLGASDQASDALVSAILEQKVTAVAAFGAWRYLVIGHGTRAPGPTPRDMWAAPDLAAWRTIPSWDWHRAGVEPPQSKTIVRAARHGQGLMDALVSAPDGDSREAVLTAISGIGPWTAAEVRARAFGDADAVSVGDYHLAHHVGFALTGARTDDEGMLELLAPWAGQRQRVIRLIVASGVSEPRRAPRLHPEDHRTH